MTSATPPENMHKTTEHEEAIQYLFEELLPSLPETSGVKVQAAYKKLKEPWGCSILAEGTEDEIRAILAFQVPKTQSGMTIRVIGMPTGHAAFEHFLISPGPDKGSADILASCNTLAQIIRVWKTRGTYYACGPSWFTAETELLSGVPDQFHMGMGQELLVRFPDVDIKKVFSGQDPHPPQRLTDENKEFWAKKSEEEKRLALWYAYLQHPLTTPLVDTINYLGFPNEATFWVLLNKVLQKGRGWGDSSENKEIQEAFSSYIWRQSSSEDNPTEYLQSVLEVKMKELKNAKDEEEQEQARQSFDNLLKSLTASAPERELELQRVFIQVWFAEEPQLIEPTCRIFELKNNDRLFRPAPKAKKVEIGKRVEQLGGISAQKKVREAMSFFMEPEFAAAFLHPWGIPRD